MKRVLLIALLTTIALSSYAATFTSTTGGLWSNPLTWGGAGVPDAGDDVIINGHTVTIDISPSGDLNTLTINTGSNVTLNVGIDLSFATFQPTDVFILNSGATFNNNGNFNAPLFSPCTIYGTFNNAADILGDDNSSITFASGSNYVHKFTTTAGNIPLASWDVNSTVTISGYTTSTVGPNQLLQPFGNFIWNTTSQTSAINLSLNGIYSINGNFSILSTNNRGLIFANNASYTLTIGGNFTSSSGGVTVLNNAVSQVATVSIVGNFLMTTGTFGLTSANNATTDFNIAGNFTKTLGTFQKSGTNAIGNINFNGTSSTQFYSISGTAISSSINYVIKNLAVVDVGTSAFTGTLATFNLQAGGTLKVGSTDNLGAIQNGSTNGNIRVTGLRSYAGGSTIEFNGSGTQYLGAAYPTSAVNLTINNPSNVVIPNAGTTILASATLKLQSGNLVIGPNTLTIQGSIIVVSGFINASNQSTLVINNTGVFGTVPFDPTTVDLGTLTINSSSSGSVTLGSNIRITNTLNLTQGDLVISGRNFRISGIIAAGGTGKLYGDASTIVTIEENASSLGSLIFNSNGSSIQSIVVDRVAGASIGSNVTVNNTLALTNGPISVSGGILTLANNSLLTRTSGSISTSPTSPGSYNVTYLAANTTGSELPSISTLLKNLTINSTSGTVTLSSPITINGDLTLTSGSFDNGSYTIAITGNFVNNSTYLPGTGTVVFSGSSAQNIGGANTSTFNNLTISNLSGVTFNGNLSSYFINGTLSLSSGALIIGNNTLTLNSTISSTGGTLTGGTTSNLILSGSGSGTLPAVSGGLFNLTLNRAGNTITVGGPLTTWGVVTLTAGTLASGGNLLIDLNSSTGGAISGTGSGSISGNIAVQKTVASAKYHYVSSPLQNTTVAELNDDVPLGAAGSTQNLYYYDETNTSSDRNTGWTPITSIATPLNTLQGYDLYFTGSTSIDLTGTYNHALSPSIALTNTPSSTSAADGWNLVGNPYPSPIDWNASGWTKTNVNDAIYFWNPATNSFASYVGGGSVNGGTNLIPSLQGFWVNVGNPGAATLGLTNSVRTTVSNPAVFRTEPIANMLKLSAQIGDFKDETVIKIDSKGTFGFDGNFDAYKMLNIGSTPSFYSYLGGNSLSINTIPGFSDSLQIPLVLTPGINGTYTISASNLESFDGSVGTINLYDKLLNKTQDLMINPQYTAVINKTDSWQRFYLNFSPVATTTGVDNSQSGFYVFTNENNVTINLDNINSSNSTVIINNSQGNSVSEIQNTDLSKGLTIATGLNTGVYFVKVITGNKVYVKKVFLTK